MRVELTISRPLRDGKYGSHSVWPNLDAKDDEYVLDSIGRLEPGMEVTIKCE